MFLLLLLALLIGYVMGIYQRRKQADNDSGTPDPDEQDLLKSLGLILRDEPDVGLDQFLHRLDVTPATLDTHLAVGNLFRRKGEISRAIQVHQNLISRPRLSPAQQRTAQLELAKDFAQAGLLDRAERLLLQLFDGAESERETIARLLVDIYQDEKEWQKAIDAVEVLGRGWFVKLPEDWQRISAHFQCELAAQHIGKGDLLGARRLLKAARNKQKGMARAYLLLAELELLAGNYREALQLMELLAGFGYDSLFFGLHILGALAKHEAERGKVLQMLRQAWRESGIAAFLLEELHLEPGRSVSERAEILALALQDRPSLRLLEAYLSLIAPDIHQLQPLREPLAKVSKRLAGLPQFRCCKCGFTARQLHWLCPSCKTWGNLQPIKGLEGV